tara:strand:- start:152 stop:538 length:387 start_codon:yes stop_codon:yes gene_type:complete
MTWKDILKDSNWRDNAEKDNKRFMGSNPKPIEAKEQPQKKTKTAIRPTASPSELPKTVQQQKVPPAPNLPETKEVRIGKFNDASVKILNELNSSISGNFGTKGMNRLQQSGLIDNIKLYLKELRDVIA